MKMIKQVIAAVLAVCTIVPFADSYTIEAEASNSFDYSIHQSCVFDVDVVNDEGGFDHKGCYSDYTSAYNAMNELGQDAVIRNSASASPTKIIAMVSGVVVTNPYRTGQSLNYYYSNSNLTGSQTYSQQYQQGQYTGTASYSTSDGSGSVGILLNGFYGYISMVNCDLIPTKYFTDNLPIQLGGYLNGQGEPVYTMYPEMNYYLCGTDSSGNKEMYFYSFWGWSNSSTVASQTYAYPNRKGTVLPAADWMVSGTKYYSYNGYDFYTDEALTQYAGTYYNYYQFMPLRTASNLTASDLQSFLTAKGYGSSSVLSGNTQTFIDSQNTYGVNALLVFAMAIHESAYGTSNYAVNRYNLFGWNAVDSNPNGASYYSSVSACVIQHMSRNLNGYLDIDDSRHFGMAVGNKGNGLNVKYASDIYWGISIASYAYQIDKMAGFKDLNTVTLGVVSSDSDVYFTKSSDADTEWFDIKNSSGQYYPRAYVVAILSEENEKYKTQSSDHLTNGSLTRASSSNGMAYDWTNNVAWIDTEWITLLENGSPVTEDEDVEPTPEPTPETTPEPEETVIEDKENATYQFYKGIQETSYDEETHVVTISGAAYFEGAYAAEGKVTDTIILVNEETGEETEIAAENTDFDLQMTALYEGYIAVGYEAEIDLDEIEPGNYYLMIQVINGDHEATAALFYNNLDEEYTYENEDGYTARFYTSPINSYRVEISVEKQSIDMNSLVKSSQMTPYFGFDDISIEDDHLIITNGYGILRNASMSAEDNVEYTLYLQDENGNVESYALSAKESAYDFSTLLKSDYDLSMTSFDADIDLSEYAAGTYRIYLEIKTDDYDDIYEIYNIRDHAVEEKTETRTYSLTSTDVRARYVLTIEE